LREKKVKRKGWRERISGRQKITRKIKRGKRGEDKRLKKNRRGAQKKEGVTRGGKSH